MRGASRKDLRLRQVSLSSTRSVVFVVQTRSYLRTHNCSLCPQTRISTPQLTTLYIMIHDQQPRRGDPARLLPLCRPLRPHRRHHPPRLAPCNTSNSNDNNATAPGDLHNQPGVVLLLHQTPCFSGTPKGGTPLAVNRQTRQWQQVARCPGVLPIAFSAVPLPLI